MWKGTAKATYDSETQAYYFKVEGASPPPYTIQEHVTAIIDVASDGTLAGIEIIDLRMPLPPSEKQKSKYCDDFETFWKTYPKRQGSNPKEPAYKKWKARVKTGVDKELMLRGAQGYAIAMNGKDPQFIQQTMTWVNQAGWEQYANYAKVSLEHEPYIKISAHEEPAVFDQAMNWARQYKPGFQENGQEFLNVPEPVANNIRRYLKEVR